MAASLRSDGRRLAVLARTLPLAYRGPDRLVVVSDAARDSLVTAGALRRPDRAVTIYNPVDAAGIRQLATRPLPGVTLPGGTVVLCVARLHQQKDHRTLLRALRLLPPEYVLVLAGDGPLRAELSGLAAELGIAERTVFLGGVANPYPLMRRADLVALPSAEEGFGLVALEAAVLGVPFVGSDAGGLAELCAVLGQPTFPVGDPVALADRIVELAGRDRTAVPPDRLARFDPAHVADSYLALAGEAR
jgi:glycosyltransferase involved in cell wall biosynthesis